jgi:hypothetical protein
VQVILQHHNQQFQAQLNEAIDISLSFGPGGDNPEAFGILVCEVSPIVVGDFTGSVAKGSGANCDIIRFCAHGNTTHTECFGHITAEHQSVAVCIEAGFYTADLITVAFEEVDGQAVIGTSIACQLPQQAAQAIVIRSLPNTDDKRQRVWSGHNPPYFTPEAMALLVEKGYSHLLTDLPSVDPEVDGGALTAHHVWWNVPAAPRTQASITELIFVPNHVADGLYLLNLQFPKIMSDAAPSRPQLYSLHAV